jgi:hypothetical protein
MTIEVHEYDTDTALAAPPIPALLDTIDKQVTILTDSLHACADRLGHVLRPVDDERNTDPQRPPPIGGSNIAIRLGQTSAHLGELGVYVNQLMARLEL